MNFEKIKDDLVREEGFRPYAYQDHLGFWTIGIGTLIDRRKGGGITRDEAEFLLENRILRTLESLRSAFPWFDDEPEPVQEALLQMGFQMGVKKLTGFNKTIALLKQKKYKEAADQALTSTWAKQTPERARRVTDLIRNAK